MKLTPDKWVWMGHAAHFILGHQCRFHLATYVGDFIVSTVGEYLPDSAVRKILWETRRPGVPLKRGDAGEAQYLEELGFEEIGYGRTFETMVFRAVAAPWDGCCPWRVADHSELDVRGYMTAADALYGHMDLCQEWAAREDEASCERS